MDTLQVTINLSAEDRARLDSILDALRNSRVDCARCAASVAEMFSGRQELAAVEAPAEEPTAVQAEELAAVQAEPPKENAPQATVEEVQAAVVRLTAAGRKAEAREIVHAYAERISAIPEDKLGEALQRLRALEG